jgi:glyoxylase-like metal-dependent hydrolase (beta-lactamase superfamily II)
VTSGASRRRSGRPASRKSITLWTTHYHGDHVGALIELAKQFPVGHFYDHGKPHANDRIVSSQFLSAYESLSAGKRTIVKPGDKVKMTEPGHHGCRSGQPVHPDESAGRRESEFVLRGRHTER